MKLAVVACATIVNVIFIFFLLFNSTIMFLHKAEVLHCMRSFIHSNISIKWLIKRNQHDNKCVSRLARRKSHHTALRDAPTPQTDCHRATAPVRCCCEAPLRLAKYLIPEVMPPP